MSDCRDLTQALAVIAARYGWTCRATRKPNLVVVGTGRQRATSEPILLSIRVEEQTVVASDGGETLPALVDAGLDLDDAVHDALWKHALTEYGLSEIGGRVLVQLRLDEVAHGLNRLADALVALDALRLVALPPRTRPRTLAGEVEDYLRQVYSDAKVRTRPTIRLKGGLKVAPGLTVDVPDRGEVLVQPGAATSITQSYDHAFATFSLAARGGVPKPQRLTVLGGSVTTWDASRLRALSEVTYVGFWSYRERLRRFLDGDIPGDPLMAPPGVDVPMLP